MAASPGRGVDRRGVTIYLEITQIAHDRSFQMFSYGTERGRCGHGRQGAHRRYAHGWGAPGEYGGFPFGGFGRGPRGRARKARRGDIRTAALLLLAEEPRNGYQI